MSHAKRLAVLAGATFGMSSVALAQGTDIIGAHGSDLISDARARESFAAKTPATVVPFGQIGVRYTWNQRDDDGLDADAAVGFHIRRAKMGLKGTVGEAEEFSYRINGAFDRAEGSFVLEDALVDYQIDDNWTFRIGQFKLPILDEESKSSTKLQGVERSVMNEAFNQDRSQGIMVTYGSVDSNVRFSGALSDGVRTPNSDFTAMNEADWAFTGRVDWMFEGQGEDDWDRFDDYQGWANQNFVGRVGGALHYQSSGDTVGNPADEDLLLGTVDVQVEGSHWSAFAAVVWSHFEPETGDDLDDFGIVLQGGYFVDPQWELFARYSIIMPDDDRAPGDDEEFSELNVGVNYFFFPESHASKFSADLAWFLSEPSSTLVPTGTGTGLLSSTEDTQWAFRLQYQLYF